MYAVFRSGGKQYRAQEGDRIKLEKLMLMRVRALILMK